MLQRLQIAVGESRRSVLAIAHNVNVGRKALVCAAATTALAVAWLWMSQSPNTPHPNAVTASSGANDFQAAADRIARTVTDPAQLDTSIASKVVSIDVSDSGWLFMVTHGEVTQDDARAVCTALSDADALPLVPTFVVDRNRHLIRACASTGASSR